MTAALKHTSITAFAPATIANVGCGFDIFGLALQRPGDQVLLRVTDRPGVRITSISGDAGRLPRDPQLNTAGKSLLSMLKYLQAGFGIDMELNKQMAIGSGLGSSAASAVASVFALNAMLQQPLDNEQLLAFAIEGEKLACGANVHLDNIAACLYGGFILVRSRDPIDIVRLNIKKNYYCTVLHPQIEIRTELARRMLQRKVPLSKAITQGANVGAAVCGLLNGDDDLLSRAFEDVIVLPDRAELIPRYYRLREAALSSGAIGFSISGSGPSVFALSGSKRSAEEIAAALNGVLANLDMACDTYLSTINKEGPKIVSAEK